MPIHVAYFALLLTTAGNVTELMGDPDGAMDAYQQALRQNRTSVAALNAISCILRTKEQFPKAVEYLNEILRLDNQNGEVWGSLGTTDASEPSTTC